MRTRSSSSAPQCASSPARSRNCSIAISSSSSRSSASAEDWTRVSGAAPSVRSKGKCGPARSRRLRRPCHRRNGGAGPAACAGARRAPLRRFDPTRRIRMRPVCRVRSAAVRAALGSVRAAVSNRHARACRARPRRRRSLVRSSPMMSRWRSRRPRTRRAARSVDARRCAASSDPQSGATRSARSVAPAAQTGDAAALAIAARRIRSRLWLCAAQGLRAGGRGAAGVPAANIRATAWRRTRSTGSARPCTSVSAIATRRTSFLAVSTKYENASEGAGCAAAAWPVARRAE